MASRLPTPLPILALLCCVPIAAQEGGGRPYQDPPLGLDLYVPAPPDNPLTPDRVALGRRLFFDPLLSVDGSHACATCHDPARAFTDGRALSVGVFGRVGTRSVPTLVNRAYGGAFFWDGRVERLEDQVLMPIQARDEMDLPVAEAVARVAADPDYARSFRSSFGRPPTTEDLGRALAGYVRTIMSGGTRVDRYFAGDARALSTMEREGRNLFAGKAKCWVCHTGPTFTDEQFHNTGVAWQEGRLQDLGRAVVTEREEDRGAFKTPTLREVARTPPYMHDGSFATLEEVVDFYSDGGRANPWQDTRIGPLDLSDREKEAIVAFLRSLSGEIREGLGSQR